MKSYGGKRCFFGHLHGTAQPKAFEECLMVLTLSGFSDFLQFTPRLTRTTDFYMKTHSLYSISCFVI
jgi:predicted phosphohydrolase